MTLAKVNLFRVVVDPAEAYPPASIFHPFKHLYFAGGEPHVELKDVEKIRDAELLIDARIGAMNDLGTLLAVTDAARRLNPQRIDLFIPYFPGARQDREEPGFALTSKIYADIINQQHYNTVFILDPHSSVVPALLERCVIVPHVRLIKEFGAYAGIICPDAGAERRTLELARDTGCENVVFARKKRDPKTGALSGFSLDPIPYSGTYLVADDICDGGGTFLGLAAEYQKDPNGTGPLHLWTTHGIYSKGLEGLSKVFTRIGCSDSFPSKVSEHPQLTRLPAFDSTTFGFILNHRSRA